MKIVFLNKHHPKNVDALIRMCKKTNTDLEFTEDFNRCRVPNYDLLISNQKFFNPDLIPESIKIIFGPQLFIFPEGEIVGPLNQAWSKRCIDNTLSKWVEKCYLEVAKSMVVPTGQFPFAVDTVRFSPTNKNIEIDCLVYFKDRPRNLLVDLIKVLNDKSISFVVIEYGKYRESDYIELLHKCKFMLVCGRHESQGFALEEAMSVNIPLLLLDCKNVFEDQGTISYFNKFRHLQLDATCVPYWSDQCGLKTTEIEEIPALLDEMMIKYSTFEPRQFILDNLSEEVCMKRILDWYHK